MERHELAIGMSPLKVISGSKMEKEKYRKSHFTMRDGAGLQGLRARRQTPASVAGGPAHTKDTKSQTDEAGGDRATEWLSQQGHPGRLLEMGTQRTECPGARMA